MSKSPNSQNNSLTTGSKQQGKDQHLSTGVGNGSNGLATTSNGMALQTAQGKIPTPQETDAAVRTLLKPLQKLLSVGSYDKDNNPISMTATAPMPKDLRQIAITGLEKSLSTMPHEQIGALIAKVYMKTARRQGEQLDLNMAIECYMEELEQYPADIVQDALTRWPRISKWWPTWFDLADIMDWRVRTRRLKLAALQEAKVL